jgi:two-component system response regulator HydG
MAADDHEPSLEDPDDAQQPGTELGVRALQLPADRSYVLVALDGPESGRRFEIEGASRTLVGTSPACTVQLSHPTVSRRHVAIEPSPNGLHLTDLGSTNGTRISGVRVIEAYLSGGETIELGDTKLRVETGDQKRRVEPQANHFGRVIGASPHMQKLFALATRVAASNVPVLIEGETGTGKEALAEAIHELGPRAARPFVVVDCTAIAPALVEAELFGHEKGAFTGAVAGRPGLFEEADGGTVFIDEIGDLELPLQAKLLRAIERGEVRRVGSSRWTKVDVRIISATRRDLDREVQSLRFRDDLFYRLAVTRLELPPLRVRTGDVAVLTKHFWKELGGAPAELTPELIARFESWDWPGNVRELHNSVAKRLALGEDATMVGATGRPPPNKDGVDAISEILNRRLPFSTARQRVLNAFERRYVEQVLSDHRGNVGEAAKASGVARRYFQMIRNRARD